FHGKARAGGARPPSSLAGLLENTPTRMIRWIQHPRAIVPGNVMPETGVPEQDARDMAASLYSLQ
ncbi:MAG TPA: hypothetical protein VFE93_03980, partial [Myxococcaceae bacterium]|nr:hypothetical protein [Myxococcaceae bacterium]